MELCELYIKKGLSLYMIFLLSRRISMAKNRYDGKNMSIPVENHKTAAWANIKHVKRDSRVPLPSNFEVENAKEWVDNNEK